MTINIPGDIKNLADKIIRLQANLILLYGGLNGLRDRTLLESALGRVLNAYSYGNNNVFDLAAAYAYGLTKNHPFMDGNKRTAFSVCFLFLIQNDLELFVSDSDVVDYIVNLSCGKITEADFSKWLQKNCNNKIFRQDQKDFAVDILIAKYHLALKQLFNK